QTRIKTEVDALDLAFKAYKEKYGSYPPMDLQTSGGLFNVLKSHIARAFPRYDIMQLSTDLGNCGVDKMSKRPDHALVFFLSGYGPDPAHPFVNPMNSQQVGGPNAGTVVQRTAFFDFDKTRLIKLGTSGNMYSYVPPGSKSSAPYLYMD